MPKVSKETQNETKKKSEKEPEVTVFGKNVSNFDGGKDDAGSAVWGVLLILAGLLLLANVLGILTWDFWQHIWQFWPVLLILLGVHILLGNNIFARIVLTILAIASFAAVIIWGLIKVDSNLLTFVPEDLQNFVKSLEEIRK